MKRQSKSEYVILGLDGKDSLVTWLVLLRHWPADKIIPIHQMYAPDPTTGGPLRYKAQSLDYYSRHFGRPIATIPHPSFWGGLAHLVYQPPERYRLIDDLSQAERLPLLDHHEYSQWVKDTIGIPDAWTAIGIKAADGPTRRRLVQTHGSAFPRNKTFYPTWDLTRKAQIRLLREAGLPLSIEYALDWFSRSLCGYDARFTLPLKQHAPDDFERVRFWFPLVEFDHARLEYRRRLLETSMPRKPDPGRQLLLLQEDLADGVVQLGRDLSPEQQQAATAASNLDATFWAALVFQSTENKQAFLEALGAGPDQINRQYLSGEELAARMGINLPVPKMPTWRRDPKLAELVEPALGGILPPVE